MNTKALRQKILDLAIHGKLVPQDPNDEPASVLLERIKAEKERLIKEGKIKRTKRSKAACDKPHYPYELPKGWCWCKLEEIVKITNGRSQKNVEDKEGLYPIYGSGGIIGKATEFLCEAGTTIIGRKGTINNPIFVKERFWNIDTAFGMKPQYAISDKYFFFFCQHFNFSELDKSTAVPSLTQSAINDIFIPIPPTNEQKRIVKEIIRCFSVVEILEKEKIDLQLTIEQTKSKILDLAIHGKLVPQDPTDEPASKLLKRINPKAEITCDNPQYGNLPKGWCICRLKDMAKVITGSTPSKSNKEYYGGNFPFYKPADLDLGRHVNKASEYLTQAGKNVSRLVPSGTTAVCCIGSIGKVGFLEYEGTTNQQINCVIPSECLDNVYLYYSCSSQWFYSSLIAESSAVTISIVNKSKMENVVMPLPPLQEQHRIVAKIEELFTQLDKIEASL